MRLYAGLMCLLLILYCVHAAPRPNRNRRAVSVKTSDDKAENKQEHEKSDDSKAKGQQKADKKQFVPYVPAYNMGDVISEDSQPVQVVQIRDLSITNGVIKKSNIVQL